MEGTPDFPASAAADNARPLPSEPVLRIYSAAVCSPLTYKAVTQVSVCWRSSTSMIHLLWSGISVILPISSIICLVFVKVHDMYILQANFGTLLHKSSHYEGSSRQESGVTTYCVMGVNMKSQMG